MAFAVFFAFAPFIPDDVRLNCTKPLVCTDKSRVLCFDIVHVEGTAMTWQAMS